jgi:hypothetical protein
MKRVLLTGANHLVESHILDQLLAYDLSVRAVVASREEAEALRQSFPRANPSRLEFAIVATKDIGVPGAYDDALKGNTQPFDTVIHALAADPNDEADCLSRFITLETDTLINFLTSVRDVGTSVERVIIITSLSPFARWLVDPFVLRSPVATVSSPVSFSPRGPPEVDAEYVLATSQASDNIVYNDIRKWISDALARFDLVAITTPSIYGPSIRPLENSSDLQEANRRIWNICSNDSREHVDSPPYGIDFYADVRVSTPRNPPFVYPNQYTDSTPQDLAFATVQAVFTPQAKNRRFVISAGTMPHGSAIADFLVGRFPELGGRVRSNHSPPRRPPSGDAPVEFVDTRLAASILCLVRYRAVEETLTDVAGQLLELHKRKEWKHVIQS